MFITVLGTQFLNKILFWAVLLLIQSFCATVHSNVCRFIPMTATTLISISLALVGASDWKLKNC